MKLTIPDHIKHLVPYPPGKPLEELEREYGITGSIKMASNENSLGPSPKAVQAISAALTNLHRYPDGSCYYLGQALANNLGVQPEQIVFGNGSDEIIALLAAALVMPGDEVISSKPSFLVYPKVAQAQGGINRIVPLDGMRHDLKSILEQITDRTRLIFLDNPNNPTGTIFGKKEFEAFLSQVPDHVVTVLDEAYIDFTDPSQRIDIRTYLNGDQPVVGLRTFSKAYGLAGLRVGYGLMPPQIADCLHRVRGPFNVNSLAQVGAIAALKDTEHYDNTLAMTRNGISWLTERLSTIGLSPLPTHTNFFLVDLHRDSKNFYQALLQKGVIVRPMSAYALPTFIRITVGTATENERLLRAITDTLAELN
ncbi:MAG: histidinol-phosphate transaminase [Proteobacteria bacterium]|nr:histidinol-phosphate transaminase [Desulfobulbaceae bacterium]MBU4154149.1 histidinol-phosphate transaminase [Pseudomonadota bacterium]MDP2104808.1 histidinol-phosphate transaminase [Desulfobulbaceae bacterium]